MSILFLLRLWPVYGGGESVTRLLANEFITMGYSVHVAYFKYSTCGTQPIINKGINEHYIERVPCDEYTSNDIEDAYGVSDKICEIINSESIDFVINQWWPLAFVKDINVKTNAKVIWCLHTIFAQPFEKPKSLVKWVKYTLFPTHYKNRIKKNAVKKVEDVLPYVDKYIFLSEAYKKQFLEWSDSQYKNKIGVIPNPIPFNYSISEEEVEGKENIVLVVGRMRESIKRYSYILRIWQIIEKKYLEIGDWKLVMVGDGESLDDYKKMASDMRLKKISFVGYQDPTSYYKKSKITLMTSKIEGFPMVIIESQQMGVVPIAMNSFPALQDVIKNEKNGIIVPNNDINTMSKKLIHLMKDSIYYNRMSKCAILSIQNYSLNYVTSLWKSLLENTKHI